MITEDEVQELIAIYEHPGSLYARVGDDDADEYGGTPSLPGMTLRELGRRALQAKDQNTGSSHDH